VGRLKVDSNVRFCLPSKAVFSRWQEAQMACHFVGWWAQVCCSGFTWSHSTSSSKTPALRAPMADDLRELIAALKMSAVIERIGDYAKNIAKRVPQMSGKIPSSALEQLGRMGEIVVEMIRTAMDAYAKRDVDLARAVTVRDEVVDQLNKDLFVDFVAYVVKNPENATEVAHLLFTAKNLERIGDHTTNVAQMIYFTETGENLPDA
jgi:phosphate transport system protein